MRMRTIQVQLAHGALTAFQAEVIVFKSPQRVDPGWLDRATLDVALALEQEEWVPSDFSLHDGAYRLVKTHGRFEAQQVLLIGVPSVISFGYQDLRTYSARALRILAKEVPTVRHIAMNIH